MIGERTLLVLVVDPDRERRAAAAETLRRQGCEVGELDRARDVAAACRRRRPAVVLVDEDACREDDLPVVDVVKRDPDLFGIGVVVRARRLDVDDAIDGLGRGAHGVLVDPVADAELVTMVRSAARTGLLQEALRNRASDLESLAFTDPLSGIPNRRFLDRQLEALLSGARRHGRPVAVALVDIDHFKAINDRHGHTVGDEVIAAVARRLADRLRDEDHHGRFGGEEFLVLLPDTDPDAAAAVAEDLRRAVGGEPIMTAAGPLTVTASVGWAAWEGDRPHALVGRADDALYEAKAAGRNAVRGGLTAARTSP